MITTVSLPVLASAMGIFIGFLQFVFIFACILLVLVILLQRPREQGLGAALGGDMAENFMGAGASDTLARITVWLGGFFFVGSLAIALLFANYQSERNAGVMGEVDVEALEAGETTESPAAQAAQAILPVEGDSVGAETDAVEGDAAVAPEADAVVVDEPATDAPAAVETPEVEGDTDATVEPAAPEAAEPAEQEITEPAADTTDDSAPATEEAADAEEVDATTAP